MAKSTLSVVFILGALVSLTLGATVSPLSVLSNPDAFTPAKLCPVTCSSGCAMSEMTCLDIPDIVDCEALSTACHDQCDQLCGCLTDCQTQCLSDYGCNENPEQAIAQLQCLSKRVVCSGTCQLNCPVSMMFQNLATVIQMVIGQASGYLNGLAQP